MSELKRKREEEGYEEEEPETADATCEVSTASPAAPSSPSPEAAAPATVIAEADPDPAVGGESAAAAADTTPNVVGDSGSTAKGGEQPASAAAALPPSPSPRPRAPKQKKRLDATPAAKIMICGKEITVKHTGGRKKRKHPIETLIFLAYKGQLALACKANNMVSSLEIYREMKTKGIEQDLSTHLMVLSLCGGSPGEKDELNPGNGSTGPHVAALDKAAAADAAAAAAAEARVEGASAQDDTHSAAEAALQIFSEASKGGTVSLPESAYTAVIRACCLDGRADRAREVLEALKRADVRPRVRTYAPLLEAYSALDGRLQDCMALWREAVSLEDRQPAITMTEREYLHLIAACTRAKDEKCFLEVMSEYMDDVLQPRSRHSWDVLKAWFRVGPNDIGNDVTEQERELSSPMQVVDSSQEGEIVPAGAAADDADSVRSGGQQRKEEPSGDGAAGVEDREEGVELETIAATATAPPAVVASPPAAAAGAAATPASPAPAAAAAPEAKAPAAKAPAAQPAAVAVVPPAFSAPAAVAAPEAEAEGPAKAAADVGQPAAATASSAPEAEAPAAKAPAEAAQPAAVAAVTPASSAPAPVAAPEAEAAAAVAAATSASSAPAAAAAPEAEAPAKAAAEAGQPGAVLAAAAPASSAPAVAGAPKADAPAKAAASTVPTCAATPALDSAAPDVGVAGDAVGGGGDTHDTAAESKGSPSAADGGGGWNVVECKIGSDGKCENCGEVLRSVDLSKDDEERLLRQIEELVCTNEVRTRQWEGYRGWLERRGKGRYDVIIDGANLGYYKQAAFSQDELADLQQVDWAVRKYEEKGMKPLVVLHSRHLVDKWLSDESKEIYKRWREADIVQSCAPKNNDDWYWLYAAVYTGGRVLVLTNDEMRDHHFSMLSHRSFQRWKERHQARFSFAEWNEETESRELIPEEPRSYSKRTQKGVDSWHVPLERSSDWLCVRWRR